MKKREVKDLGASIRARLTNIAKETKRDFDALLLQYFQERFETFKSRMGGDIPRLTSGQAVQELMDFSAGASCGYRNAPQNN